jgi:hypothetical protein
MWNAIASRRGESLSRQPGVVDCAAARKTPTGSRSPALTSLPATGTAGHPPPAAPVFRRPHRNAEDQTALAARSQHLESRNRNVLLVALPGTHAGVENREAILSVPGIDASLVGTGDLAMSMGHAGWRGLSTRGTMMPSAHASRSPPARNSRKVPVQASPLRSVP